MAGAPTAMKTTFLDFEQPISDLESKIEERGGKTVMPPSDVPGGPRMAQFEDPEGNRVGLVQAGTMQQPQEASAQAGQQDKPA